MVVILPAPFGPANQQTKTRGMARVMPSARRRSPQCFVSPLTDAVPP